MRFTVDDEIAALDIPAKDRLWALIGLMDSDSTRRLWACDVAEGALRRAGVTDARSWAAIDVARRFARGEADANELAAARSAARAAARSAARVAAWNAARVADWNAVWAAARVAARDAKGAARDAARDAVDAARDAVDAARVAVDAARVARGAAWAAAWAEQVASAARIVDAGCYLPPTSTP